MNVLVKAVEAEFRRYKSLAESAIAQVPEGELSRAMGDGNSIAVISRHISGNLRSRFTDFLTSDGEKPWRNRDEEFEPGTVTHAELTAGWIEGWDCVLKTLESLADADLSKNVTIRGQSLGVHEALFRSLAHIGYHVGQIVYLARAIVGERWRYLSIPPGGSTAYNAQPTMEKPAGHLAALDGTPPKPKAP